MGLRMGEKSQTGVEAGEPFLGFAGRDREPQGVRGSWRRQSALFEAPRRLDELPLFLGRRKKEEITSQVLLLLEVVAQVVDPLAQVRQAGLGAVAVLSRLAEKYPRGMAAAERGST